MSFHCSLHLELLPFPGCFKLHRTEKQSFLLNAGENWRCWGKLKMYMTAVTALITLTQAEGTTTPPQEQQVEEVKRGRTFPSERGEGSGLSYMYH